MTRKFAKLTDEHILNMLRLAGRKAAVKFYLEVLEEAVRRGLSPAYRRV